MWRKIELLLRVSSVVPRYWLDGVLFRLVGNVSELERFRNIHKGRPMLVVGNGPSLKRTPLNILSHVPSIGMNKINILFPQTQWRPNYIMCINNLVVKQNRNFFETSAIPLFIAFKSRWFLNWKKNRMLRLFNINVSDSFSPEFPSGVGRGSSVSYAALQMAYFMGANPVVIFGIDHRFKSESGKKLMVEKMEKDDENHFHPDYFKGQKWGVPDLDNDRRLFRMAKAAFEADGREILDATIDGALPVFRKVSVDEAIEICCASGQ